MTGNANIYMLTHTFSACAPNFKLVATLLTRIILLHCKHRCVNGCRKTPSLTILQDCFV